MQAHETLRSIVPRGARVTAMTYRLTFFTNTQRTYIRFYVNTSNTNHFVLFDSNINKI